MAILGAAMRHMSMLRGVGAIASGSTSPKKRNSEEEGSCRMKKADDSYAPVPFMPWLTGTMRTETFGNMEVYSKSGDKL